MLDLPLKSILRTTSAHLQNLREIGVKTVADLLHYFPRAYTDRTDLVNIIDLQTDQALSAKGDISQLRIERTKYGKTIVRAKFSDATGSVQVIWFNQPHILRIMTNGDEAIMTGKLKFSFGKLSLISPQFEVTHKKELVHSARIVPLYHETGVITSKWLREKIKPLIDEWTAKLQEYLPEEVRSKFQLMSYQEAVKEAHFPSDESKLDTARHRLAFDELFILQLKALQKKWEWQHSADFEKKPMEIKKEVLKATIEKLPFSLTEAQKRVLKETLEDLKKPYPMSRLIQGDVGSGKTVAAGLALLNVIQNGYQCAVMAPTEILARQHYQTLSHLLRPFSLNIQFISGSTPKTQKNEIINQMKTGTIDLVIGTHALIQEGIGFKKFGLAVIDEQHRFGVKQREILKSFGTPHLLSLSATPIPRTLAMVIYGDQDLSIIDEMPAGRQEIITRIVPEEKRSDAYCWIEDQVKKGRQVFLICPLIERSGKVMHDLFDLEMKSVIEEYERLKNSIFPHLAIGFLHGKLKPKEKDRIMADFKANKIQILVSTSVVEVGIDVPNATIMMIEGAERFGLSQLHQFRGRVGRSHHQSYCFLFTNMYSSEAAQRLQALVQYSSGFKIAEVDLQLRGPGELYGVRQAGIPDLKMASLADTKTIQQAREAAQKIIEEDPKLIKYPLLKEKLVDLPDVFVSD